MCLKSSKDSWNNTLCILYCNFLQRRQNQASAVPVKYKIFVSHCLPSFWTPLIKSLFPWQCKTADLVCFSASSSNLQVVATCWCWWNGISVLSSPLCCLQAKFLVRNINLFHKVSFKVLEGVIALNTARIKKSKNQQNF